jgi:hypothetical protein
VELGFYSKGCIGITESSKERPGDFVIFAPIVSITRFDWEKEPMFEASITAFRTFQDRFDIPFWGLAESIQADWPVPGDDVDALVWLQGFLDR